MFRELAQGNELVSAYSTNWNLFVRNMTNNAIVYMKPQWYGDCNCATSAACTQPSELFLSGFVVSCFPLESFLRSTIECLYVQSCVDQMVSYVGANYTPSVLNNNSRFVMNVSIDAIVQQMFIEHWSFNISFESFFEQCRPTSCSYTLIERHDLLDVATTLLGLHGGVTITLRFAVPLMVRLCYKLIRKRRQTTSEVMPM
ncbi:unnamed protein product [Rotaria sp. Silwood2]|nr:unnamed protein product [Rotaria sp. Silwood2]CAF4262350.1 unnamed protein product [Rotaria sp. Silwood2]CAF4411430.1 unnamed protein product [Rotaria sp. Silwood2]